MTANVPSPAPPGWSPPATGPPDVAGNPPTVPSSGIGGPHAAPWPPTFAAVFREHYGYIVHFLRNLRLRERDLDDVAQEAFVAVFARFHLYDASRPVRPWLCGFALRCARAHRRRCAHLPDSLDDTADPPEPGAPLDEAIAARRSVRRGLTALSDEQREVFVLHELLGFSVPEVAEIVGILLNTAYSRLRLARGNFVKAVQPSDGVSDV